ncbi:4-(cytidine 5'-diphospho)-2-C-methyl-D-erythritol kinase [Ferruginibacter albus]|uniref:4-(cytidine 5'-diphospho)-2-C-methyl-D-erythritol kinase n=1 Tax=Ferruginibacter albus TaxID=2875540 RepID=UPI001CC37EA6|nr:4-(cytidine 5'-diphospho)-2-C-methyl-D-erythritol kinase [Ferruginibacter albus]UAY53168.1 4-(cytidine 5'-diphospho)-2-C-methyl-D-erythritol kinase [Ferruginibacter albus]
MLSFPNCKINLGLHILGKREDGFHNLETIFYPVPIKDVLEILPNPNATQDIIFTNTGLIAEQDTEKNICSKAYHLLKKDFPQLPAIKMHLHKTIPLGAGLGGGSADGSFTLNLLNEKFQLGLSSQQLIEYALQLGSDCPFFIINKPCVATGRGEILEEIRIDLSNYQLVLVNPGIHVNTGWAFSQLKNFTPESSLKQIIQQPVIYWKELLKNDFEEPVFRQHPAIQLIKDKLYQQGAVYAAMSGSGSSMFGLFEKGQILRNEFDRNYFVSILSL